MNLLEILKRRLFEAPGELFKKTFVQEPKAAVTTARFTLSESRKEVVYIPAGTRITAGDGIYFETDDYAEVTAGESYVDIDCTCQTAGTVGTTTRRGNLKLSLIRFLTWRRFQTLQKQTAEPEKKPKKVSAREYIWRRLHIQQPALPTHTNTG